MPSPDKLLTSDEEDLSRLGYAQQLLREMGGFSNFAISFSVISILTGAVLLYGYGLRLAGPIVNTVGWPLVSVMTLAVAASMAELASLYPTHKAFVAKYNKALKRAVKKGWILKPDAKLNKKWAAGSGIGG